MVCFHFVTLLDFIPLMTPVFIRGRTLGISWDLLKQETPNTPNSSSQGGSNVLN